jgi:DNA-directed RNA polymerase subunit RPC12/RpoP
LRDLPALTPVTATDNCDTNPVVTRVFTTNGICPIIIVLTWTATDDCTNTTSASVTNVVFDTVPPVLVGVPTNATYQCLSDVPPLPPVTATDNCDGTNVQVRAISSISGVCPYIMERCWIAVDSCSNEVRRCQIITILDTIPPVLVGVPTNRTFQCLSDLPPPATVTATDNCDSNVVVIRVTTTNGICPTYVVHCWTAMDRCTNFVTRCQTNTIRDTIPPMLIGVPPNATYPNITNVPPPGNVTAIDNCDGPIPVTVTATTNGTCPATIIYCFSAVDRCTNRVTQCQTNNVFPEPCIYVTKECPKTNVPPNGELVFSGIVSNCGNITLTNVYVVNDQPLAGTIVVSNIILLPGQYTNFTGSYRCSTCGPFIDTLTASGADTCRGAGVTNKATAICEVTIIPCIKVEKFCPPTPTGPFGPLVFSGCVSNCGNVTLTNVFVYNDHPVPGTLEVGPLVLPPGKAYCFTNSYVCLPCGPFIDTLVATGNEACGGRPVMDWDTAICPGVTHPALTVTKVCPPTRLFRAPRSCSPAW